MPKFPEELPDTSDPTLPYMIDVLATMDSTAGAVFAAQTRAASPETPYVSVGELFHDRGYVTDAATLPQTLEDLEHRTTPVLYRHARDAVQSMTEADAIRELRQYLAAADTMLGAIDDPFDRVLRREIQMLREGLFFMGDQEFRTGAAGIAALWRTYLERDPDLSLMVPYAIDIPPNREYKKSQELVVKAIMQNFSADDPLRKRICAGRQGEPPQGHRSIIIATDDCVKTGLQLTDWYRELRHPEAQPIEVHLLAASEEQLEYGIRIPVYAHEGDEDCLPVAAYYRVGGDMGDDYQPKGPLTTGAHTTVDFNFRNVLEEVSRRGPVTDEHGHPLPLPALSRVERVKRSAPRNWEQ